MEPWTLHYAIFMMAAALFSIIWMMLDSFWRSRAPSSKASQIFAYFVAAISFPGLFASVGWVGYMRRELDLPTSYGVQMIIVLLALTAMAAILMDDEWHRQRYRPAPTT